MRGASKQLAASRIRTPSVSVTVSETAYRSVEARSWDDFAQLCATSFQGSHSYLRAWAIKHRFRHHLRLFEFHMQENHGQENGVQENRVQENRLPQKIGQCAIGVGGATSVFMGELQLLADHSDLWTDAMRVLLGRIGPGRYRYGSNQSLDKCREEDLKRIETVAIESVRPLVVEAVDFSRWSTWDDYWRAISSNSRRNARHAEALIPDLSLVVRQGLNSAVDIPALLSLRAAMYRRKGIAFGSWRAGVSDLGMILGCPDHVLTAVVSDRTQVLAAITAIEFGPHVYYANGGSRPDNRGAAWYLTLSLLRRTYERDPAAAKFIMGYVDYATHDETIGGGLLRFRRSCRVSAYPTSVVTFAYGL